MPADQVLGDGAAGILGSDNLVNLVAVEKRSSRAVAALQVVREACSRCVACLAEGTLNRGATVGARVQVHLQVVGVVKRPVTVGAVVMVVRLVLATELVVGVKIGTKATVEVERVVA